MERFSFTSWEYNFTPCYQSPLCFTCSILAYSSMTLCQSSNKDSVSMCCLLLGYSLEPRLNSRALCTAGSSVMTINLSNWNGCSHSEYQFDGRKQDWQVQKFEVRWLHKAWRQFSSILRLFVQYIVFVINSVNGDRFLEFTEPNWKINCTIFLLYEVISLLRKTQRNVVVL